MFAELTYHAAYEPQRAIRTERFKYVRRFDDYPTPVLANCDDSPSKHAYLARGWAKRPVPRESLHDLFFNPGEGRSLVGDPTYEPVLAELRDAAADDGCRRRRTRCSMGRFRRPSARRSTPRTRFRLTNRRSRSTRPRWRPGPLP